MYLRSNIPYRNSVKNVFLQIIYEIRKVTGRSVLWQTFHVTTYLTSKVKLVKNGHPIQGIPFNREHFFVEPTVPRSNSHKKSLV